MASSQNQVPYHNQLQFNLQVPLTTKNLAAHHSHPCPILVERVGGQHAIPGKVHTPSGSGRPREPGYNFSVLSEDRMEMMTQLANRDLKNKRLQEERQKAADAANSIASHTRPQAVKKNACSRLNKNQCNQKKQPLRAREADKNRRLGAIQTPPPKKQPPRDSFVSINDSQLWPQDADVYFPTKAVSSESSHPDNEEMGRLRQELEGCLRLIMHVQQRAITDGNTKFLQPSAKANAKDGFLDHIEDLSRARARVTEQNIRSARSVYNLRQKVKQLQRDLAHTDLNNPMKKAAILSQVTSVQRGAAKSLQTFVHQLPHQDLTSGLPSPYHELAVLLRQMEALAALTMQGRPRAGESRLLALLDDIDSLNTKWCLGKQAAQAPAHQPKGRSTKVTGKAWVSDTKTAAQEFGMPKPMHAHHAKKSTVPKQPVARGRQMTRPGKENRGAVQGERRAMLKAGVASLVAGHGGQGQGGQGQGQGGQPRARPDYTKGYMLPPDLKAKRERAQRAVAISNQRRQMENIQVHHTHQSSERGPRNTPDWASPERMPHFAERTISATLKMSPGRWASAPASPKRKEVNFDLEEKSPLPWVPAGSGSKSARKSRSRSLSPDRSQNHSFYVRDLDNSDIRTAVSSFNNSSFERNSSKDYGYKSLPTQKHLRSRDISDSLLDDLESRLLQRLTGRPADTDGHQRKSLPSHGNMRHKDDAMLNVTDLTDTEFEDSGDLDITDLTNPTEFVRREAVALMDAPTLENVKLRLAEMQREQREIRQRWSSLKFSDTKPRSTMFTQSCPISEVPLEPPAIEVTRSVRAETTNQMPTNKGWGEEPLLFTKPSAQLTFHHTVAAHSRPSGLTMGRPAKKLLTMKQTTVERITADRDRYKNYLRRHSHHPAGKFDPWKLMEDISDEIFSECLSEVAQEVEAVNEEIADTMYRSEFMVDQDTGHHPTDLPLQQAVPDQLSPLVQQSPGGLVREKAQLAQLTSLPHMNQRDGGGTMVGAGDTAMAPMSLNIGEPKGYSPVQMSSAQLSPAVMMSPGQLSPARASPALMSPSQLSPARSIRSVRSISPPSSYNSDVRAAPKTSAHEPMLDDVSNFMGQGQEPKSESQQEKEERSRRVEEGGYDDQEKYDDEEFETEDEDEDEDDEEDYSDDDFEEVSNVD